MPSASPPHLETLLDALPPLHRKVRHAVAAALAWRLMERSRLEPECQAGPLPLLLRDVLTQLEAELADVDEHLARFTRRYHEALGEEERQAVLVAHLQETVPSAWERRKDLRALHRWLGFDTLRERLEKRRRHVLIQEETALRCLAGLLRDLSKDTRPQWAARLSSLGPALLSRAVQAPRSQNQLAALEALRELLGALPAATAAIPDAGVALTSLVEHEGASPFLQAEALRVLLITNPPTGVVLLRQRLRHPPPSPRDFLFRRQVLEVAAPLLDPRELRTLAEQVARGDPSEYVRMGLCGLLVPLADHAPLLRRLAGLEPSAPEQSPRVRASAVLATAAALQREPLSRQEAHRLLVDVLRTEAEPLVLRVACEQVALAAETAGEGGLGEALPPLVQALAALRARAGVSGPVLEAAAAAEQVLLRVGDAARRAWTAYLARVAGSTPTGGRTRLVLEPAPEGLPPLPEEPAWLGAILADLSYGGDGLYAHLEKGTLTLWRGDRYQRRLWRLWHELRRPAPNKRQAFRHTLGRKLPGRLRAHPARLDEITATQVPGERVHVASQGGWGRHLPTVDDLLDLPLGARERVHLFSSHGVTTLTPPASLLRRLRNRLRLTRAYARLAALRLGSLDGHEPRERRRFVEHVERELGITVHFAPYRPGEPPPSPLATLFGAPRSPDGSRGTTLSALSALGGLEPGWLNPLAERLVESDGYFLVPSGNGLGSLGLFTASAFTLFLGHAWRQRQSIRSARHRIPLCVGGWGTRGKSGTERLKAALLGGLGFDVFAKTTGSEAMFVHTAPSSLPFEFFIFRPYDKATIWEQRDMLELAADLGVEVFLWECMALQPAFVELLQNDWMRDDLATLTNAYPDHEDIQGPAGIDVATVITRFMPVDGTVVTTEDHFLPLFLRVARVRGTRLIHSPAWEAELLPEELLALFPYREHPRNVMLVATLAEQLGVPRTQALALMAEHVQPEIGVLKVFPPARVRGRLLAFINGHSANERTGFLNNWRRTGLDAVDPEAHPGRAVLTVINNRWDRVARSEVFARILVEDAPADRHVLIGTNLEGLQKYVRDALDTFLERLEVVTPEELGSPPAGPWPPEARLARELARLKIPRPSSATFLERLERYAQGAGLTLVLGPALRAAVEAALSSGDEVFGVARVREQLAAQVGPLLDESLQPGLSPAQDEEPPEVLASATAEEVRTHALYLLARMVVHARLRRALPRPSATASGEEHMARFHRAFRSAYRELFLEQLVPVQDAQATGDQLIDVCARAAPPGLQVSILGAQNIKGTGLDWVYRWLALDRVQGALDALRAGTLEERRRALEVLEGSEDSGLVDSGLARAVLPRLVEHADSPEEAGRLERLAERARTTHAARLAALQHVRSGSRWDRVVRRIEKTFDYLDSVDRRRLSELLLRDLREGRVSHARAALELRRLYERQKGGWLRESFRPVVDLYAWLTTSSHPRDVLRTAPERALGAPAPREHGLGAPGDTAVPVPPRRRGQTPSVPPADEASRKQEGAGSGADEGPEPGP